MSRGSGGMNMGGLEDALPEVAKKPQEDEDLLGRLPVREAIEQARSTGIVYSRPVSRLNAILKYIQRIFKSFYSVASLFTIGPI